MLMVIIETVVGGLALAGILAIIHVLHKKVQARRLARANELAAKEAESQRLAQRRKSRIFSPVGIRIPGQRPGLEPVHPVMEVLFETTFVTKV